MSDGKDVFYVHDNKGNAVAAKFLRDEHGAYVTDPNTAKAQSTQIFDASGKEIVNANPNAYMIVPADYSIEHAVKYGKSMQLTVQMAKDVKHHPLNPLADCIEGAVCAPSMAQFVKDFMRNGREDLQRSYNGKRAAPFVAAFTDAASFHYGLVMSTAGISMNSSEAVGGIYNVRTAKKNPNAHIDTKGPHGLSTVNGHSIQSGYQEAQYIRQDEQQNKGGKPARMIDELVIPKDQQQKLDRIRGTMKGAEVTLTESAVSSTVAYAPAKPDTRNLS